MKKSKVKNIFASSFKLQASSFMVKPAACSLRYVANRYILFLFAFCILNFIGCATMKEMTSGIAGVSTKVLEVGRKDAIIKTFNYDYNTCYNKVEDILKHMGAYIYAEDQKKQMIAIYVSQTDTTVVGLFFKSIDTNNTQIEVSSLSTYAKEFIAGKVFFALEKSLKPQD